MLDVVAGVVPAQLDGVRDVVVVQVVGPVTSRYWWQGSLETATEWLCIAKTTAARLDDAMAAVAERHPYDVPEITAVPVVAGSPAYLSWLAAEVAPSSGPA